MMILEQLIGLALLGALFFVSYALWCTLSKDWWEQFCSHVVGPMWFIGLFFVAHSLFTLFCWTLFCGFTWAILAGGSRERRERHVFDKQVKLNLERARRFTAARDAKEFAILAAARNARRHAA